MVGRAVSALIGNHPFADLIAYGNSANFISLHHAPCKVGLRRQSVRHPHLDAHIKHCGCA